MSLALHFEPDAIPFVIANVQIDDLPIQQWRLMIDTGSSQTIFNVDLMIHIGISIDMSDVIVDMYGVGGRETVLEREIRSLRIGEFSVGPFTLQRGPLNYGFPLDGIIGSDFLHTLGLVIDYQRGELRKDS